MQLKKRHRKHTVTKWMMRCRYCGVPLTKRNATIDHIVPRSKQGTDDAHNLAIACNPCNNDKDNLSEADYRMKLHRRRGRPVEFFYEQRLVADTNT